MQNLSDQFLITSFLSLVEVGVWTIVSKHHAEHSEVTDSFFEKYLTIPKKELDDILYKFMLCGIIHYEAKGSYSTPTSESKRVLCRKLSV